MTVLTKRETWRRPKAITPGRTPDLTDEERARVVVALRFARVRHGSWAVLAKAMGANRNVVEKAVTRRGRPTVTLALRLSRVVGVPVEDVLSGAWPREGCCPMCGRCG